MWFGIAYIAFFAIFEYAMPELAGGVSIAIIVLGGLWFLFRFAMWSTMPSSNPPTPAPRMPAQHPDFRPILRDDQ